MLKKAFIVLIVLLFSLSALQNLSANPLGAQRESLKTIAAYSYAMEVSFA